MIFLVEGEEDIVNYKIVSEFTCCGKTMITVIIKGKVACVMERRELLIWNKSLKREWGLCKRLYD